MNFLLLILVAAPALVLARPEERNPFKEAEKWINIVNNNPDSTWKAGRNFNSNLPARYTNSLLGTVKNSNYTLPLRDPIDDIESNSIPRSFDSRKKWPHCRINEIRDQGDCGSCWAVAAASVFSDRLCIASKGKINLRLSQEEITSCCDYCGSGCGGGSPEAAWIWIKRTGIVTGGNYGSDYGCQPYELRPCEHHIKGSRPSCPSLSPGRGSEQTPSCKNHCTNRNYKKNFSADHWKAAKVYGLSDEEEIQKEVLKHGPVEAGFKVYDDFLHYKSGIYQISPEARPLSGHAVKLIGWGEENNVKYWLVQNSWNSDWGEKGYFRIIRGVDECGFEAGVVAGIPKL